MQLQVELSLPKLRHQITGYRFISSLVGCLLSLAGSVYAEPVTSRDSVYSIEDSPLLADYRSGDREQRPRYAPDAGTRRERPHPREHDRNWRDRKIKTYETEPRERYRHPPYQRFEPPVVQPRYREPWRHHHPRERIIVRPFRYVYPTHRHHIHDGYIWGLLSFTAITLAILDNLNDQQQREHERALYDATTTPLGETIYWKEGNASGAVTPTREGTSSSGRYCREYQSEVSIGGNKESIYGTACRNADGSWEIEE